MDTHCQHPRILEMSPCCSAIPGLDGNCLICKEPAEWLTVCVPCGAVLRAVG